MSQEALDFTVQKVEIQTVVDDQEPAVLDLSIKDLSGKRKGPFRCGSFNLPHLNVVMGSPPPASATLSAGLVAFDNHPQERPHCSSVSAQECSDFSEPVSMSPPGVYQPASPSIIKNNTLNNSSKNKYGKFIRPFKAFIKDCNHEHDAKYILFRCHLLSQIKVHEMASPVNSKLNQCTNPEQLPSSSTITKDGKTKEYWEKRRKNNEAAKRSRDARRRKEDEMAIRTAYLEEECFRLKQENASLKQYLNNVLNEFNK